MNSSSIIHDSFIGSMINRYLASHGIGPVPDPVILSIIASLILIGFAVFVHRNIRFIPSGAHNGIEAMFIMIEKMMVSVIGPKGPRYFPVIATLGLFILISNLMGLIPFLVSPTSDINVTLGCALFVFIYYHSIGILEQGWRSYFAHFGGPIPWLAPLMFPLELISHLSRVLSLSLRLFGNILGEDIILILLILLSPWYLPIPVPMMVFEIFTSILQAFIFIMLSMVYIAGAVAQEGH